MFCGPCVERLHRTGNFTAHLRVPIDTCDECLFQVMMFGDHPLRQPCTIDLYMTIRMVYDCSAKL